QCFNSLRFKIEDPITFTKLCSVFKGLLCLATTFILYQVVQVVVNNKFEKLIWRTLCFVRDNFCILPSAAPSVKHFFYVLEGGAGVIKKTTLISYQGRWRASTTFHQEIKEGVYVG
ncbi:hypothetical protein, partial [Lacticaseibacillus daqingensis]|uniref:hypothetical protein n=1 Tax=Lacticaseibacillus daqingensis TaxID=2486014 RepID=UPI001CDB9D3D